MIIKWDIIRHPFHADFPVCKGVRPLPKSVLDMTLNNLMVRFQWCGSFRKYPLLPSLPGLLEPGVVAPDRALSMDQIERNCVLMLNWITWNRIVLIFKLRIYAQLNCLKRNYFWHWNCTNVKLNCSNRTVLTFNCVWTKTILIQKPNWIITVWVHE